MLDATDVAPSLVLEGRQVTRSRLSRSGALIQRFARRQPIGAACAVVIVLLVLVAVFAGTLAPYSPTKNRVGPQLASPSRDYPFGTDNLGRDVLSRVIYGARISLYVGIAATLLSTLIGTLIGLVTGYLGGAVDYGIQRVVDAVQAVPPTIMLIAIMVALGPSITNVIIALSARGGLALSRVVRGSVFGVRSHQYVESALATGASELRVMLQHILPNIVPTLLVLMSIGIGANIIAEASLSFLGYGVPPPDPTWGGMISAEGRTYMLVNPWILVFPTLALSLVVYTFNMLGDALRDELDPRLRGSR
jgi:peptide/nickel transport system permease protein